jgi:hypothetical protein
MGWVGLRELEAALVRVAEDAEIASKLIVRDSAAVVERAAKKNFQGHHKPGEAHTGGDKPNVVTGALRRSITADPIRSTGRFEYGTRIGPRTVYARSVELGHTEGSRKFPYFKPAVDDTRQELQAIAAKHWRAVVLKGGRR